MNATFSCDTLLDDKMLNRHKTANMKYILNEWS